MAKSNAGQPPKITKEVLRVLDSAFLVGATDAEACVHADIGTTTLYKYCSENPQYADRKETLKNMPTMKAKSIVSTALDEMDLITAHKVIDRKEGTKIKQDVTMKATVDGNWKVEFINATPESK